MIKILRRLYRGACTSEQYGPHPGTVILIAMTGCAFIAGFGRGEGGIANALLCGGIIFASFFPFYLAGCWGRGDR